MSIRPLALALASAALLSTGTVQAQPDDHIHYGGPRATYPHEHGDYLAFGRPAKPSQARLTVAMSASDDLRYSVPTLTVQQGDVVNFVLTNTGTQPHQFVLGDKKTQRKEEQSAQAMPAMAMTQNQPNAVTVAPGETQTLAWKFDRFGEFQIACHLPGAYQAGMVSYVAVTKLPKRGWR